VIRMAQDEWISIADEMPEFDEDVLVFVFDNTSPEVKYPLVGYFLADGGWQVWGSGGGTHTVTHWMPLPARPKGCE